MAIETFGRRVSHALLQRVAHLNQLGGAERRYQGPLHSRKLPAFYGPRKFIKAFAAAHDLSLTQARPTHFLSPIHFMKTHFNIIPPRLRPGLRSGQANLKAVRGILTFTIK